MKPNLLDFFTFEITLNYILVFSVIGLAILFRNNNSIEQGTLKYIRMTLIVLLVLGFFEGVDKYFEAFETLDLVFVKIRFAASWICYCLRPIITLLLLFAVIPKKDHRWYFWIPEMINILIFSTAFFSFGVYTISDDNCWHADSPISFLRYFIYVASVFNLTYMIIYSYHKYFDRRRDEFVLLTFVALFSVVSAILESIFSLNGFLNDTISVALVFYYLYINLKTLNRDPLTGFLNRTSYYADIKTNSKNINAVISIDMNNLKELNDEYGHDAGDTALKEIAYAINKSLTKKSLCYRVGGDEFIILCRNVELSVIKKIIEDVKLNMLKTDYTVAIGCAINDSEDIEQTIRLADEKMYEDKKMFKNKQ